MGAPQSSEHLSASLPQLDAKNDPPDRTSHEDGCEDPAKQQSDGQQEDANHDVADSQGAE